MSKIIVIKIETGAICQVSEDKVQSLIDSGNYEFYTQPEEVEEITEESEE